MDREKLEGLTSAMNRLRGRLFTLAEASGMENDKITAFKRSVRDVTSLCWEQLKLLIEGEDND